MAMATWLVLVSLVLSSPGAMGGAAGLGGGKAGLPAPFNPDGTVPAQRHVTHRTLAASQPARVGRVQRTLPCDQQSFASERRTLCFSSTRSSLPVRAHVVPQRRVRIEHIDLPPPVLA